MHVFVDSSKQAYDGSVYLVQGRNSNLVMAKTRPTPLKTKTLPQLELIAVVVGARLATFVRKSINSKLSIQDVHYWSVSQITLHWLMSKKKKTTFIRKRVDELLNLSNTNNWHYCPTNHNAADLLTRGIRSFEDKIYRLWMKGPEFIHDKSTWPK